LEYLNVKCALFLRNSSC